MTQKTAPNDNENENHYSKCSPLRGGQRRALWNDLICSVVRHSPHKNTHCLKKKFKIKKKNRIRGQQTIPWYNGSPWWWAGLHGSVWGDPGAWRTSLFWGTPPCSRSAGICSHLPVTRLHSTRACVRTHTLLTFTKVFVWLFCITVCFYLIVDVLIVESDVDGERRRVMMWPQGGLLIRTIAHNKVHDGLCLWAHTEQPSHVWKLTPVYVCVRVSEWVSER